MAYSEALAGESVHDSLKRKYNPTTDTYEHVTQDDLLQFARTVAYKVFHNLKNGHEMDSTQDPLTVDDVPAPQAWPEHYETTRVFIPMVCENSQTHFLADMRYLVETTGLAYCEKPFYTAPLKFGVPIPLLTLTNRPELHPRGTSYTEDTLGRVFLRKLYIQGIDKGIGGSQPIELEINKPLEFELTFQRDGCTATETVVLTREESAVGELLVTIDSKDFPGIYQKYPEYPISAGYEVYFERIKGGESMQKVKAETTATAVKTTIELEGYSGRRTINLLGITLATNPMLACGVVNEIYVDSIEWQINSEQGVQTLIQKNPLRNQRVSMLRAVGQCKNTEALMRLEVSQLNEQTGILAFYYHALADTPWQDPALKSLTLVISIGDPNVQSSS
jgi:hypothetical protein